MISQLHDPTLYSSQRDQCPHLTWSFGVRESVWTFWRTEKCTAVACYRTPDHPVNSPATKPNAPFRVHVAHKPPTAFVAHLTCGTFTDFRNLRGQIRYLLYRHAPLYIESCQLLRKSGKNSRIQNVSSLLRCSTRVYTTLILYFLLSRVYIANRNKNKWKPTELLIKPCIVTVAWGQFYLGSYWFNITTIPNEMYHILLIP
jgi:hypothetical protein